MYTLCRFLSHLSPKLFILSHRILKRRICFFRRPFFKGNVGLNDLIEISPGFRFLTTALTQPRFLTHQADFTCHCCDKKVINQSQIFSSYQIKTASLFSESVRKMSSSATGHPTGTNRLALEKSPYLLQHAHNPVDWYPWGEEAFTKAREENKPIFLSVGYSTCHWCHVMERESFENLEISHVLNENFVSIKVDREERPDVDRVYMAFVQASTGSGGWPMSVWLTPDLKPIVGGTYFPPNDRYYNRPGFKSILSIISQQWKEDQSEIESQGTKILDVLKRGLHETGASKEIPPVTASRKCFQMMDRTFDEEEGGFGTFPKFPQPVTFNVLFRYFKHESDEERRSKALHMALFTLKKMANGGIHDHICHGFHRYSTDKVWHVPHFEKMLYDQGQLAVSYADAYQITNDEFYADLARDIFTYVNRDLSHPEGGFYSAQDADSLPSPTAKAKKEGAFCAWEYDEIQCYLSKNVTGKVNVAEIFCHFYGLKEMGNVDPLQDPHEELKGKNVLKVSSTLEDTASKFELSLEEVKESLDESRKILYEVRKQRPPPHLDNKMLSAWNGLMMSGLARGGQTLKDPSFTERAVQAAAFLKKHMFIPESGILLRSAYTSDNKAISHITVPIQGFLDDYSYVIRGLLDLYEACYDDQWLAWAEQLQTKQNELFWDEEGGGYFSSQDGDRSIVLRMKEDHDGAEPSPNSVSALNLLRLSIMAGNPEWWKMAERIFKAFAERIEKVPLAVPELVSALLFYHSTPKQIIIIGDKENEDTKSLVETVHKFFLPNKVLLVTDGHSDEFLKERLDILSSLTKIDGKATAYVCEHFTCSLPVNSCEALQKQLEETSSC